ncbi:hypothetical protein L1785_11855 [Antribacter sp. KLBMP9083]|uniref:AMIN-like domain-containing protein n=1 Tax=Antribacter soli TaxID=2910976 RepID=A0AA41QEI7_9MICO|nr:hypothetical protein [Antribacter soli]MCF4121676.1 hypothetical protein [Antribacter soli]
MTTSRARSTALGLLAAALLTLTACTTGGNDTPTPGATSAEATETASATPEGSPSTSDSATSDDTADAAIDVTTVSPFPANTEPDTSDPSGTGLLTVVDVRTGRHEGYDRVVFELDGTGEATPGWAVLYVDQATDDGSGNPVEVEGDAILSVLIHGTAYPEDSGVEEFAGERVQPEDTEAVKEVVYRYIFEGDTSSFIGIDGERKPFRAFLVEDPVRVVVDIQH